MNLNEKQRAKVRARLRKVEKQIDREFEFQEFGATNDLDFKMSNAHLKGLFEEKEEIEGILK